MCQSTCPVNNCPIGFWPHLSTCIQLSASTENDSPQSIPIAEEECLQQGARLYQPRSSRAIKAMKFSNPSVFDPSVSEIIGIHSWASTQSTAIGMQLLPNSFDFSPPRVYYRDGSVVGNQIFSDGFPWTSNYPKNNGQFCIVLNEKNTISNGKCNGYSNTSSSSGNQPLSYICEARPLETIAAETYYQACQFPFKVNSTSDWSHSCHYELLGDGSHHVWCPTALEQNSIIVSQSTESCSDERYTTYDGPG